MPNLVPIAAVIVTALIGFAVYRYKNRIAYRITTISVDVPEDLPSISIKPTWSNLEAERLELKNFGFREIENLELHLNSRTEPFWVSVDSTTSLSKAAVKITWQTEELRIEIATLPAGEEVVINFSRVGQFQAPSGRLRGTGGKYKIVDRARHDLYRNISRDVATLIAYMIVVQLIMWFG